MPGAQRLRAIAESSGSAWLSIVLIALALAGGAPVAKAQELSPEAYARVVAVSACGELAAGASPSFDAACETLRALILDCGLNFAEYRLACCETRKLITARPEVFKLASLDLEFVLLLVEAQKLGESLRFSSMFRIERAVAGPATEPEAKRETREKVADAKIDSKNGRSAVFHMALAGTPNQLVIVVTIQSEPFEKR
jgi:hypothetical protein